ncbi:c-type cytochrome [Pandoraea sp. SD6-2]|uniref:c-type cytochrome n=1 Tax=Pandoraea sp. SD6-2 TaxID=1286093 RepID=UPI00032F3B64|nr:c-type cytochrome [Pandoraea sp. SD6-2]EON12240.1 putative periplasmic cytochrome type-C oxidoreductase signal peptide protein [Pandoraea sp. SD6-2]
MKHSMVKAAVAASLALGTMLAGGASPAYAAGNIANGKALVDKGMCVSCHGANLNAPITPEYPKLAGQYADYVYNALRAYQNETSLVFGRSNAIMKTQVMSNPATLGKDGKPRPFTSQELKDISAYIESLPGDLVTKK